MFSSFLSPHFKSGVQFENGPPLGKLFDFYLIAVSDVSRVLSIKRKHSRAVKERKKNSETEYLGHGDTERVLARKNGGVIVHVRDPHDDGNVSLSPSLRVRARYLNIRRAREREIRDAHQRFRVIRAPAEISFVQNA